MSSKNVCQTCSSLTLRHKGPFRMSDRAPPIARHGLMERTLCGMLSPTLVRNIALS
jgi:hypothetical protein